MTYANSVNCQINTGEKQHAAMPKQQQDAAAEGGKLAAINAQDQRLSGVNLQKDDKGNVSLDREPTDEVMLSTSSVSTTSNESRAKISSFVAHLAETGENMDKFAQKTIARLGESIEDAERNRYNSNRLVAKIAEFKIGILQQVLSRLGVSARELDDIRQSIRAEVVSSNESGLVHVVHDETLSEVVAHHG
ncbi:hypothetical protein ACFL4J_00510 [Candidatus Margulisiibacteriota bacterium]